MKRRRTIRRTEQRVTIPGKGKSKRGHDDDPEPWPPVRDSLEAAWQDVLCYGVGYYRTGPDSIEALEDCGES